MDKICERAVRYFADPHRKVQHMHSQRTIVLVAGLVFFARNMWTQESNAQHSQAVEVGPREANDTNAANNPIHPLLTVDLRNYFAPSPKGFSGRISNQGLLRVSVPLDVFGFRQIATHNLADQYHCQCSGRTEYWSWRSDGLRLCALSRAWDRDRSWAAYRGADGKRGSLRLWEMASRRCRNRYCTSQLGTIGRGSDLSAFLLWK